MRCAIASLAIAPALDAAERFGPHRGPRNSHNFFVPIALGFLACVAALAALSSPFGIRIPYAHSLLDDLQQHQGARAVAVAHDVHALAIAYAATLIGVACAGFVQQRRKG